LLISCGERAKKDETGYSRKELVNDKASLQTSLLQNWQKADSLYMSGTVDTTLMQQYVNDALIFVKKYPEESSSPEVLLKAGIFSLIMAKYTTNEDDLVAKAKQGIELFDQLEKIYPDYENVKFCYIHRGDIFDNVLHDYDHARIEYNTFIQKYPDDSLTLNIKEYVVNVLGKSPDELLADFEAKSHSKK
jgi:tetratricopeptide (TPR) repeat protein